MLNSTSPTTLVFPVEDLGGLQFQGKALHGPLEQQPIFSKSAAARRGIRCALLACRVPVELVSPSWQAHRIPDPWQKRTIREGTIPCKKPLRSGLNTAGEVNRRPASPSALPTVQGATRHRCACRIPSMDATITHGAPLLFAGTFPPPDGLRARTASKRRLKSRHAQPGIQSQSGPPARASSPQSDPV